MALVRVSFDAQLAPVRMASWPGIQGGQGADFATLALYQPAVLQRLSLPTVLRQLQVVVPPEILGFGCASIYPRGPDCRHMAHGVLIDACEGVSTMRSDSQLQSDVLAELRWRPTFDAAHIGVAAKDGVVTLTGQVAHYTEKAAAEDAAKAVYGVKGIADDIQVEMPSAYKRTDQDVAAAALSALKWDVEVPSEKVKVVVEGGWVSLNGTVDWQFQKDAAGRCVRYLRGVIGVTNQISVKPSVKASDVFQVRRRVSSQCRPGGQTHWRRRKRGSGDAKRDRVVLGGIRSGQFCRLGRTGRDFGQERPHGRAVKRL